MSTPATSEGADGGGQPQQEEAERPRWAHDVWVDLSSKAGKPTGRVRLKISWRPKVYTEAELAERARAAERDQLLSMWGMVDRDGSGALDAAELREVLGLLGMGEELDMVRVMAAIDLDGSGEVDLDEFAGWWLGLDGAQREEAVGKARALVLAPATLECTVVSARKLKKMDRLKGNDVFCVLIVDDDPQRTSTIWSTQHSGVPVWPADEGTRAWTFDVNDDQPTRLTLQAWDEDKGEADDDDLIGEAEVELPGGGEVGGEELLGKEEWQVEQWYRLRDGRGKKVGEVQLRVRWAPRQKSREELRAEDEASLFAAVMANEVAAVRLLLARGVHINARNAMGLTPYEVALDRRKRNVASYLQKQLVLAAESTASEELKQEARAVLERAEQGVKLPAIQAK